MQQNQPLTKQQEHKWQPQNMTQDPAKNYTIQMDQT